MILDIGDLVKTQEIKQFIISANKAIEMAESILRDNDTSLDSIKKSKVVIDPQSYAGASLVLDMDQYQKHQNPTKHLIGQLSLYIQKLDEKLSCNPLASQIDFDELEHAAYIDALEQLKAFSVGQRLRGESISTFLKKRQAMVKPKGGTFGVGERALNKIIAAELEEDDFELDLDFGDSAKPLTLAKRAQEAFDSDEDPFAEFSSDEEKASLDDCVSDDDGLMEKLSLMTVKLSVSESDSPISKIQKSSSQAYLNQYASDEQAFFSRPEFEAIKASHGEKNLMRRSWS